jgi:hypothetical protein
MERGTRRCSNQVYNSQVQTVSQLVIPDFS